MDVQNPFEVPKQLDEDGYDLPASFCLNWISGTHYEAVICHRNKTKWCIVEVDDTGAGKNGMLSQGHST